ncbi:MAG: LysE family translocator [Desulfovibrio sp.]
MELHTWVLFCTAVILLTASPGPNMLLTLTASVNHGLSRAMWCIIGSNVGFILLMSISLAGLGALLATSEAVFGVFRICGACYLLYLGLKLWRQEGGTLSDGAGKICAQATPVRLFMRGFSVAMSNPKVILFFAAFFPQFIDPSAPRMPQVFIMGATFVVCEFGMQVVFGVCAGSVRKFLASPRRNKVFNRVSGGVFMAAGALVATAER